MENVNVMMELCVNGKENKLLMIIAHVEVKLKDQEERDEELMECDKCSFKLFKILHFNKLFKFFNY